MNRILSATMIATVLGSMVMTVPASAACQDGGSVSKDGKAVPLGQPKGGELGKTETPQGTTENFAKAQQEAKAQNDKAQGSDEQKATLSGKAEPCP